MFCLVMVAIFGPISLYLPNVSCEDKTSGTCPSLCTCSHTTVDCSRKDLTAFPTSLPSATVVLNLRGNQITKISKSDVARLSNLQTIHAPGELECFAGALLNFAEHLVAMNSLYAITEFLDGNGLSEFPDLSALVSLRVLTISRNKLTTVPPNTLSKLSSLTRLEMSHNQLVTLPNGTFPWQSKLEYLDISFNNLTSIIDLVEISMPYLKHLKLGYNKLKTLSCLSCKIDFGQTKNYRNVKILELNNNNIATSGIFFFSHFPSVEVLDLSGNRFQTISVGVLHGASKLRELYLDGNRLEFLTVRMFYMRERLKILGMSNNRLQGIDLTAFARAPNIERLNLAGNQLKTLGPSCFAPLKKLRYLYLERNQIRKVSGYAFRGLISLQALNLSRNFISLGQSELDMAFKPMTVLKTLDLTRNDIILVPRNAFRGLHNLQSMNLSSNQIITVQTGAFADLTSIKLLNLQAWKLICDSSARWLRNWVKQHSFQQTVIGKCKTPLWVTGKSLYEIDDRDFVSASKVNNSIKPEIIVQPKTQEAQRHSNVTLRCVATVFFPEKKIFGLTEDDRRVRSSMSIEWYFYDNDGKENLIRNKVIKTSPQEHIGSKVYRRMSEVTLNKVDYTDVGRYRCHVRNYYGDEWSHKANLTVVVLPYFTKTPVNTRVLSGMPVQISCSAKGSPVPIVKVGRRKGEKFPAVDEKRFWFKSNGKGYEFGISNVKIKDSGEYICSAASKVGVITSSMTLTVIEQPQFVRSMKSKKVIIGSTAVFECMFTGNPKPKVEWFKNNTRLIKGENSRLSVSDQLLIILGVKFEDAGTYSCRVSNALGMKQQVAKLAVVTDHSQLPNTAGAQQGLPVKLFVGIIVITVIAVAIVTSIAWVVLIWACKGRRGRNGATAKGSHTRGDTTDAALLQTDNNDGSSDPYTVPPLIASDGSGVVFSYGHLYPDNQRNFTDRDILAHIRGENLMSDSAPLMNRTDARSDRAVEADAVTSTPGTSSAEYSYREIELSTMLPRLKSSASSVAADVHCQHDHGHHRLHNMEPVTSTASKDFYTEHHHRHSPKKESIYCSCPTDVSDGVTFAMRNTAASESSSQKRAGTSSWRSHKKKLSRKQPTHAHHRHGLVGDDEYMDKYHNASSSGVESGESSSSSDSVSVANFELNKAGNSSAVVAVPVESL
eukprot:gene6287-7010_t